MRTFNEQIHDRLTCTCSPDSDLLVYDCIVNRSLTMDATHMKRRSGYACALMLISGSAFGADPVIFPSAKYPDYPFSEAVAYGGVLYMSGDVGTDSSGKLVAGGIGPESKQTMKNIRATLKRHELDMSDIIKCTVFLADIAEWPVFNDIYASYFEPGRYPARSALAASGLALGARVELECIAALRSRGE